MKPVQSIRHASAIAALLAASACAPHAQPRISTIAQPERLAIAAGTAAALPAPFRLAPMALEEGEIPGILRSTVSFVVPMPGTDMIRVGQVQEGATLQAANRNPGIEGTGGEGVGNAKFTTLILRIIPPSMR